MSPRLRPLAGADVEAWVGFWSPRAKDHEARVARVRERLATDETLPQRAWAAWDENQVVAGLRASPSNPTRWWGEVRRADGHDDALVALHEPWRASLRALGALPVEARFDMAANPPRAALRAAGWERESERVEYRTPIEHLPGEVGPFRWTSHEALDAGALAALVERGGQGPNWSHDDTGASVVRTMLEHPQPTTLEVGWLDGEAAAFVAACHDPRDGWSTLAFLGLVPEHRGKGLGAAIHRHGFAMLRAAGATLYHGGTSVENVAMQRLFERHVGEPFRRLEDWVLRP